jgi:hypothetical protein
MRKYKKTNRKINKKKSKTRKSRKSRKSRKYKFRQIGGSPTQCLVALQRRYGEVFYTKYYTFDEVYSEAIEIKNEYPGVKELINQFKQGIPNFVLGNKELDSFICGKLRTIQEEIPKLQNILLPLLMRCNYPYDFFCKDEVHYNFLLDYLDCLIRFMEPPAAGAPY